MDASVRSTPECSWMCARARGALCAAAATPLPSLSLPPSLTLPRPGGSGREPRSAPLIRSGERGGAHNLPLPSCAGGSTSRSRESKCLRKSCAPLARLVRGFRRLRQRPRRLRFFPLSWANRMMTALPPSLPPLRHHRCQTPALRAKRSRGNRSADAADSAFPPLFLSFCPLFPLLRPLLTLLLECCFCFPPPS